MGKKIKSTAKRAMVRAENLTKIFNSGTTKVAAVDNMSFTINKGKLAIILGPSGAGKTTLLNLLGGMDVATSGALWVDNADVSKYKTKELTEYRRLKVGFVFQFYNLMPNLTALENVELSAELSPAATEAAKALKQVGLADRMNNFPSQLSGGEQQRVAIARAVAKNPQILLCDEPTGALDYQTGKEVLALLSKMSHTYHKTVIIVTHNSALKQMGDVIIRVKNGNVVSVDKNPQPKPISQIEW